MHHGGCSFVVLSAECSLEKLPPPSVGRPLFRPACEPLEAREVPATLTWMGGYGGSYDAGTPLNWSDDGGVTRTSLLPRTGDTIHFDGTVSGANCENFHVYPDEGGGGPGEIGGPPGGGVSIGPFAAINLVKGYTGTVTYTMPVATHNLTFRSGTLNPSSGANDLTVDTSFIWDPLDPDGPQGNPVLNGTATGSIIRLKGATANINPRGGSLQTGNTVVFEDGATGTFAPGEVNYTGGDGVIVDDACTVDVMPTPLTNVTFNKDVDREGGSIWVKPGGYFNVWGTNSSLENRAVFNDKLWVNNQGTFIVSDFIDATFVIGNATQAAYSQTSDMAETMLENGSIMRVQARVNGRTQVGSMVISSGSFKTDVKVGLPVASQEARVDGNMYVSGDCTIVELGVSGSGTFRNTLCVTGLVQWTGGVYAMTVNLASNVGDLWQANGNFTTTAACQLVPRTVGNVGENKSWTVIKGNNVLGATPSLPDNRFGTFSSPALVNLVWIL